MPQPVPIIYLLHGEDEFAIAEYISGLEAKVGDASALAMNLIRLDGDSFNLKDLQTIAGAAPFLARRRLVILAQPTKRLTTEPSQEKFCQLLDAVPAATALVLVEYHLLSSRKEKKKGKLHWLENWATGHPEKALVKEFPLPNAQEMQDWIRSQAHKYGGQISRDGARQLVELVGPEKRLADQEIRKLLAYVNYQRPVENADVELLVADAGQTDIFILVDALGGGNRSGAMNMLQRLLDQLDADRIFGMVVRQFRLLLQAREILDEGGSSREVASQLGIQLFVSDKVVAQARRFAIARLEEIYHQLLRADEAVKTGEIPAELSLEMLVVDL